MTKVGGEKGYVQRRAVKKGGWTKAKRKAFLDALASTCNVEHSARLAGVSSHGARYLKRRDGEFAMLWAQAYAEGEERLREELVGRALGQVSSEENPDGDREVVEATFDADLAIRVLRLRDGVAARPLRVKTAGPTQAEIDAALIERFAALDRQKARRAAAKASSAGSKDPE